MAQRYDSFWAEFLGVEPEDWGTRGISFRSHVGLSGFCGFWCFRRNERVVVSAPPRWVEPLRVMFSGWNAARLMDQASLADVLGADFERAIGPAFQGCLEPSRLLNRVTPQVRSVKAADADAVELFRLECGAADWETSGLTKAELWQAYFDDDRITAIAGYRPWREYAGDPCVLTHPKFRSGGRGTAVTRAVVAEALANDKLLLYQTLEANQAAVRLALASGYERYANHVAVRLKREAPDP